MKVKPNFHPEINYFGIVDKEHLQEMLTNGLKLSALVLCNASILPIKGKHTLLAPEVLGPLK